MTILVAQILSRHQIYVLSLFFLSFFPFCTLSASNSCFDNHYISFFGGDSLCLVWISYCSFFPSLLVIRCSKVLSCILAMERHFEWGFCVFQFAHCKAHTFLSLICFSTRTLKLLSIIYYQQGYEICLIINVFFL